MSPIFLVGSGIVLFGLGLGLGYWFAYGRRAQDATKVSDIQNELDEYRRHVNEHFSETAQHFQAIGQQYRSLYEHMAEGAGALCDPAQSDAMLGFAANSDPAALTEASDQQDEPLDVVRDYAPEEEPETSQLEPVDVAADSAEALAEPETTELPEENVAESATEEVIADPVAATTPKDAERTVH